MYTLYYSPGSASMVVHFALLELGVPHELRLVDLDARANKDPDYLRLNPNGLVPTLIVDGAPVFECAALLLLLGERHPEAGLAPVAGDEGRAQYLQWIVHLANTVMPAFRQWFYPQDFAPVEVEAQSKAAATDRIEAAWLRIDTHLADNGPYLLGKNLSLADLLLTMLMRWSRNMPKPADTWPALAKLASLVKSRPAWRELYRVENLTDWA